MYAGGDPGVLFESRDGGATFELNRALWEQPSRDRWQPGAGGLCLHSIVPWPGEPDRLAVGISAAGRVADRRRRRDAGAAATRASSPRYLPEDAPEDEIALCVHRLRAGGHAPGADLHAVPRRRVPLRRRRRSWNDIAAGLPSDFGFPLALDPADADSAYVIPLVADIDRVTPDGPRARVRDARRRRDAGRRAATACPSEDAYLTVLRGAMDQLGEGASLELYFGATSGDVFGSGDAGATWFDVAAHLPPVYSVSGLLSPFDACQRQRDLHRDRRAAARRRLDLDLTVERVDAVAQAVQAAADGVGAADPVVADLAGAGSRARATGAPRRPARLRVLGDVGERLGGDEVGGGLDRRAERRARARR